MDFNQMVSPTLPPTPVCSPPCVESSLFNSHSAHLAHPARSRAPRLCAGFTLIELLVVVAILAILLSLVVPFGGMAKRKAETAICASKLHHIGMAARTYSLEYDGRFPSAAMIKVNQWKPQDNAEGDLFANQLGYNTNVEAREAGVMSCPTALRIGKQQGFPEHVGFKLQTYSGNRLLWWGTTYNDTIEATHGYRLPERYTEVPHHAGCALAFCNDGRWWKAADGQFFGNQPTFFHGNDTVANMPHLNFMNGRCNVLFMDGHVSAMKPAWGADASDPEPKYVPCERPSNPRVAWNRFWTGN